MAQILAGENRLWGISGGQLEYVSQRVEMKQRKPGDVYFPVMIIRFTDHDHCWNGPGECPELIENRYYELEFPIYEG